MSRSAVLEPQWLTRIGPILRSYLMTPHAHTRLVSPAPTSPPGSGSSAVSWFDDSETPTCPPSRSDSTVHEITVRCSHSSMLVPINLF